MNHLTKLLPKNTCIEGVEWLDSLECTPKQAWLGCNRGDWMLWLCARIGVDRSLMTLAACSCAEQALKHVEPDLLLACVWAIDAARRWSRGDADLVEVAAAKSAASYAEIQGHGISASVAAEAAYATTFMATAHAAVALDYAVTAAEAAADADTMSATYDEGDAARASSLALGAELVRAAIPWAAVFERLPK